MKRVGNYWILAVLFSTAFCDQAFSQKAKVSVTINYGFFDEWGTGGVQGDLYESNYVNFYVENSDGKYIYIGGVWNPAKNYNTPRTFTTTVLAEIPNNNLTVQVRYQYRYARWNWGGTQEDKNHDMNVDRNIILSSSGTASNLTVRLENDRSSLSYVNFSVSIEPYQPVINPIESKQCYDSPFTVSLNKNVPSSNHHNSTNYTYNWEWGRRYLEYRSDDNYRYNFLYNLAYNKLYDKVYEYNSYNCRYGDCIDEQVVNDVIYDLDYGSIINENKYLFESWELYGDDYNDHGYSFGYLLLQKINDYLSNNYYYNSYHYQSFFDQYFFGAYYDLYIQNKAKPYIAFYDYIWTSFTPSGYYENGTRITFDPAILNSPVQIHEIFFRARASAPSMSPTLGSYSDNIIFAVINPAAPKFGTYTKTETCFGTNTGTVTFSGLSGSFNTNRYALSYTLDGETTGVILPAFQTNTVEVKHLGAGNYTATLGYDNSTYNFCNSHQSFTIEALPDLKFDAFLSEAAQCFGGSDGEITVSVNSSAGDFSYRLLESETTEIASNNLPFHNFTGLKGGFVYAVEVEDKCKTESKTVTVFQPEQIVVENMITEKPDCASPANGSVSFSAKGGSSDEYNYEIYNSDHQPVTNATGQTKGTWTYSSLETGNYTVRIRDARRTQCFVDNPFSIASFAPLALNITETDDVKCYGESSGKISSVASGGAGSYKFNLIESGISNFDGKFENLQAGVHTVEVRNNNNCFDAVAKTVTVASPPEIKIVLTQRDVTCKNYDDGYINAAVTGGAGVFGNYRWEDLVNGIWEITAPTLNHTALSPGEYRFTVIDGNNCRATASATIIEPARELSVQNVAVNDIRCLGETGSLLPEAAGGYESEGYTFLVYPLETGIWQPYIQGDPLSAGFYRIMVSDRLCSAEWDNAVNITGPEKDLSLQVGFSDYNGYQVRCPDSSDGVIYVSAAGGNGTGYGGYRFAIDAGDYEEKDIFDNLPAGTYHVKTRDGRMCETSETVILNAPAPLSVLSGITHVNCYGLPYGEIELTGSGGIGPYVYAIDSEPFTDENIFTALFAGDYYLRMKDFNDCIIGSSNTVIHLYDTLRTVLTPVPVKCFSESSGEVSLNASGGSGVFHMVWQQKANDRWTDIQTGQDRIDNLVAGEYRLLITDMAGCPTASDSVWVLQPGEPVRFAEVRMNDIVCLGEPGSIDMAAAGGNDGYMFSYSINSGFFQIYVPGDPLPAGLYRLRVEDAKGCRAEYPEAINITQPAEPLDFSFTVKEYDQYHVSCFGNDDGELRIFATGGNEAHYSGYTHALNNGERQVSALFESLFAQTYILSVEDGRGCRVEKTVILTQPPAFMQLWTDRIKPATCHYDSDGSVILNASGGALPYRYNMDGGMLNEENLFEGLAAGNYRFTVRDIFGCGQELDVEIKYAIPRMTISGHIEPVKCYGENTGEISITVDGGGLPLNQPEWIEEGKTGFKITGLHTGAYSVKVTDAAGCTEESKYTVSQPAMPLSMSVSTEAACDQTPNGSIFPTAQGGTMPYRFAVDHPQNLENTDVFNVYAGTYTVYAEDINNCKTRTGAFVDVRNKMPFMNFMAATDRFVKDTLVLKDVSLPQADSIRWTLDDMSNLLETGDFDAVILFPQTGSHTVVMTGFYGSCTYSVEKKVNISPFEPVSVTPINKNPEGIESVSLYPNPNSGQFTLFVQLFEKQSFIVRINNLQGQQQYFNGFAPCTELESAVSIPNLAPGVYILTVIAENDMKSVRFTVDYQ